MWQKIYNIQNKRCGWVLMGVTALIMNFIAHYIFQIWLGYEPCVYCVYIRFSMFCIAFGALICAIKPANTALRILFGYLLTGYGIIQGFLWDLKLGQIYSTLDKLSKGGDFFALGAGKQMCSLFPKYPFDMPLHEWFPGWFMPTADCGSISWYLFGFNMPQCLYLFYGIYTVALFLMVVSYITGKRG